MKHPLPSSALFLIVAFLIVASLSGAPAAAQSTDPLALPFPRFTSLKELGEFASLVQRTTQDRLVAARAQGDQDAACRVLQRADKFRLHAAHSFRRLQAPQP
jgi:hypothetical protein